MIAVSGARKSGYRPANARYFAIAARENVEIGIAWRRGGDLNPRNPFEFTRSPGVRLKPDSATSPLAGVSMPFASARLPQASARHLSAERRLIAQAAVAAVLKKTHHPRFAARASGSAPQPTCYSFLILPHNVGFYAIRVNGMLYAQRGYVIPVSIFRFTMRNFHFHTSR